MALPSRRVWIPHPYVKVFDGSFRNAVYRTKRFHGEYKKYSFHEIEDAWASLRYVAAQSTRDVTVNPNAYLAARVSYYDWRQPDLLDAGRWLYKVFEGILWTAPPRLVQYENRWVNIPRGAWYVRGIEVIFMEIEQGLTLSVDGRAFSGKGALW